MEASGFIERRTADPVRNLVIRATKRPRYTTGVLVTRVVPAVSGSKLSGMPARRVEGAMP